MTLNIQTTLYCSPAATVELPIEKWADIKECYVKWDTLHYTLDGKKWEELALESKLDVFQSDCVDWKRPVALTVSDANTGETYYDD